jgi:hypothetical protein
MTFPGISAYVIRSVVSYQAISMLFVVFRFQRTQEVVLESVDSVRAKLLDSCTSAEETASKLLSTPRNIAESVNSVAPFVAKTFLQNTRKMLLTAVEGIKKLLLYFILAFKSTLICLLKLLTSGSLKLVTGAIRNVEETITRTMTGIRDKLKEGLKGLSKHLKKIRKQIRESQFGKTMCKVLKIKCEEREDSEPDLDKLFNFKIPSGVTKSLEEKVDRFVEFQGLENQVESIVDIPFNKLKSTINDSFSVEDVSFVPLLKVPEPYKAKFCNKVDLSFIGDIHAGLSNSFNLVAIILMIFLSLVIVFNMIMQWRACKQSQRLYSRQVEAKASEDWKKYYAYSYHPRTTESLISLGRLQDDAKKHDSFVWISYYLSHGPSIYAIAVGSVSILLVFWQMYLVEQVFLKYGAAVGKGVHATGETLISALNSDIQNSIHQPKENLNLMITEFENGLNERLFSGIVGATNAVNETSWEIYTQVVGALNRTLENTVPVLKEPFGGLVHCLLERKLQALDKITQWVEDHLRFNFPRVTGDVFRINSEEFRHKVQSLNAKVFGDPDDPQGKKGFLWKVAANSNKRLKKDINLYIALVCYGLLVVIFGIAGAVILIYQRRRKV